MNPKHTDTNSLPAIAGLGSGNMVGIEIDYGARINLDVLEKHLEQCAANRQAVYAVVAVMGTTEEGSVDRLSKILQMRQRFQEEHGMSFLVHADAAWGGYFATMLSRNMPGTAPTPIPFADSKPEPESYLDPQTKEDLEAMEYADSITVDPHKAGYIPYPAGSLVYRDGRMRHLVTWSGPYLSQGSAENIGVYGVEGRLVGPFQDTPESESANHPNLSIVSLELQQCRCGSPTRQLACTAAATAVSSARRLSQVPG